MLLTEKYLYNSYIIENKTATQIANSLGKTIHQIRNKLRLYELKKENFNLNKSTISLVGKVFGRLTVVKKIKIQNSKRKERIWLCECSCKKLVKRTTSSLQNNGYSSCGCYSVENIKKLSTKNLLNKQFSRLFVVEQTNKRANNGCIIWKCLCQCGKIKYIQSDSLISGNTKSCGCLQKEAAASQVKNLVNKNFGNLKVISRVGSTKYRLAAWFCVCFCGNTTTQSSSCLLSGHTKSCGKCKFKSAFLFIKNLKEHFNEYSWVSEYKFKELKNQRLDVYCPELNLGIEFNGEQHYKPVQVFGGLKGFKILKKLDDKKKKICKKLNICLLEHRTYKEDFEDLLLDIEDYILDCSVVTSKCS